jgi:nucleoid DNA-binding protein
MKENKTKQTEASVDAYIAAITDDARRADCAALVKLISKATTLKPKMWGTSIVGFGSYHYRYESGREGDAPLTGFSSRKAEISIYLMASFPGQDDLMAKLGKYKLAKACLYVKRLSDVDLRVLEKLVAASAAECALRHA